MKLQNTIHTLSNFFEIDLARDSFNKGDTFRSILRNLEMELRHTTENDLMRQREDIE
jgi:hypothetical protein